MGAIDLKSNISFKVLHTKIQRTATATVVGMDLVNFNSACVVVDIGTWTADDLTVTVQDSDNGSSWANVADANLDFDTNVSTNAFGVVTGLADTTIYIGYKGTKRYVGVVITDTGTGDAVVGSYVIAGNPKNMPQNT